MSTSFPAMIYRSPGQQRKPGGGTYNFDSVQTQEELDAKLANGWFSTTAEAIEAAGDHADGFKKPKPKWAIKPVKKKKPAKPLDWREQIKAEPAPAPEPAPEPIDEDAGPTREELEAKATELGIRFDGRTKDKKLGQLIQDRLSENTGE
jgi:hypothetical protein